MSFLLTRPVLSRDGLRYINRSQGDGETHLIRRWSRIMLTVYALLALLLIGGIALRAATQTDASRAAHVSAK